MLRRTPFRLLLALVLSTVLSACGFHLLGSPSDTRAGALAQSLPHTVAIIGNTDNEIVDFLRAQKPANISPAPADLADLVLELDAPTHGQEVLSQTSQGVTTEYRVSLSVIVQAYDHQKHQLLPPTRLTTYRNLSVGKGYATAEDAELERLNTDMAHELANSIAYRVRAVWFSRADVQP